MTLNIPALTEAWQRVNTLAHAAVSPIESDTDLAEATTALRVILREIGEAPGHPLDSLIRSLIARVAAYEAERFPIPDIHGAELLRSLMRERGLTQQQLAGETGISQSTLSQLLGGKRDFTVEHIRALAAFFGVRRTPPFAPRSRPGGKVNRHHLIRIPFVSYTIGKDARLCTSRPEPVFVPMPSWAG